MPVTSVPWRVVSNQTAIGPITDRLLLAGSSKILTIRYSLSTSRQIVWTMPFRWMDWPDECSDHGKETGHRRYHTARGTLLGDRNCRSLVRLILERIHVGRNGKVVTDPVT